MGKKKITRLNKKTAQALVKRVLGVSGAGLTREETGDGADIYRMTMGELNITVENDWFGQTDRFIVNISVPASACSPIRLYFRSDTLEEDCAAEEKWKQEEENEKGEK